MAHLIVSSEVVRQEFSSGRRSRQQRRHVGKTSFATIVQLDQRVIGAARMSVHDARNADGNLKPKITLKKTKLDSKLTIAIENVHDTSYSNIRILCRGVRIANQRDAKDWLQRRPGLNRRQASTRCAAEPDGRLRLPVPTF